MDLIGVEMPKSQDEYWASKGEKRIWCYKHNIMHKKKEPCPKCLAEKVQTDIESQRILDEVFKPDDK